MRIGGGVCLAINQSRKTFDTPPTTRDTHATVVFSVRTKETILFFCLDTNSGKVLASSIYPFFGCRNEIYYWLMNIKYSGIALNQDLDIIITRQITKKIVN